MHYLLEEELVQGMIQEALKVSESKTDFVEIVNKSYENSQKYLENNSEQLQEMIGLVKSLSLGYKIIGDGWGGNLLILCEKNKSRHIVDVLNKEFYLTEKNKILLSDELEQYIMVVGQPAHGLSILDPSN